MQPPPRPLLVENQQAQPADRDTQHTGTGGAVHCYRPGANHSHQEMICGQDSSVVARIPWTGSVNTMHIFPQKVITCTAQTDRRRPIEIKENQRSLDRRVKMMVSMESIVLTWSTTELIVDRVKHIHLDWLTGLTALSTQAPWTHPSGKPFSGKRPGTIGLPSFPCCPAPRDGRGQGGVAL
ncbi:hypothetical protein DPEC_G00278030 [Dallia pectoralis]|uniref:Uncharacterized protein n=1 Tax=Dallia pectoralis TaxID=75939 RepID=A0ACC2FMD2_DALPE|nr:hypothetical protein DPEC_G00278030 [Dallia pectoralis]